jgi:hypothetical protein
VRPRRGTPAALTVAFLLAIAGCGHAPQRAAPAREQAAQAPVPQADPVANWADGYCGAVTHLVRALANLPTVDPSSPERASQTSSALLGSVVDGLDQAVAGLDALDSPPLPAAEQGRRAVADRFAEIRRQADDTRRRLDAVRGDPAATKEALGDVRTTLDRVSALNFLEGLQGDPALTDAGRRDPTCQALARPNH